MTLLTGFLHTLSFSAGPRKGLYPGASVRQNDHTKTTELVVAEAGSSCEVSGQGEFLNPKLINP
jgi:hypothetical protein